MDQIINQMPKCSELKAMMVRERGVISAPTTPTKKDELEGDVASVLLKSARNIASEQKEKN